MTCSETATRDAGMTLIEMLLAMFISVIITGVISTALIITIKTNQETLSSTAGSRDAQLVSAYLSSDLMSVEPGGFNPAPAASTGCAGSPPEAYNVAKLTWKQTEPTTTYYAVAYRVRQAAAEWQLVRHSCQAATSAALSSATADVLVVGHNLRPASAGLPVATLTGRQVRLVVTDVSGYTYAISGSRRVDTVVAPPPVVPPVPIIPSLQTVVMTDGTSSTPANGKIDAVTATFSDPVPSGCASSARFVLTGLPSGAVANTPTVSSNVVTILLNEGTDFDTAATALRLEVKPDATCLVVGTVTPAAPQDKASPLLVAVATTNNGGTAGLGKLEQNDLLTMSFSEPVTGFTASPQIKETDPNGPVKLDELTITGVLSGVTGMGAENYVPDNDSVTFSSSVVASGSNLVLTVGASTTTCTPVKTCTPTQPLAGGPGNVTVGPASGIKDLATAGEPATPAANPVLANTLVLTGTRLF